MKLTAKINPKNLLKSNKTAIVSRSESLSFNSSITASSSSPESKSAGVSTPTSVLPLQSHEISSKAKISLMKVFKSRKSSTVNNKSESSSFSSSVTALSDSPESKLNGGSTPTSVLSVQSHEISSDAEFNHDNLLRSRKSSTVNRSESSSFSSSVTTSSDSPESSHHQIHHKSKSTHEISSDDWSEISADVQFELLQAFRLIDGDGDGRITRSELAVLLSRIGGTEPISSDEVNLMLNEIDTDGDGSVSLEEFGVISSVFGPPSCDGEIRGAFEFFDTDHDGRITAEELFAAFQSIGDGRCTLEDCRRMISSVDRNGDGFVCFEDFTKMMEQQR